MNFKKFSELDIENFVGQCRIFVFLQIFFAVKTDILLIFIWQKKRCYPLSYPQFRRKMWITLWKRSYIYTLVHIVFTETIYMSYFVEEIRVFRLFKQAVWPRFFEIKRKRILFFVLSKKKRNKILQENV